MNPEWVGLLAAILTTAAYVPQTIKVLRERHTQSLSLYMYLFITSGIGCWFVFGVMLGSPSLIISNGISFVLAFTILVMKLRLG